MLIVRDNQEDYCYFKCLLPDNPGISEEDENKILFDRIIAIPDGGLQLVSDNPEMTKEMPWSRQRYCMCFEVLRFIFSSIDCRPKG